MSDQRCFTQEQWKILLDEAIARIQSLSRLKGGEYAKEQDRLANFREGAALLDLRMETIWSIYAAKHWMALMTYIRDLQGGRSRERSESIEGRVDDLLVYLLLFKAILKEGQEP